MICYSCWNDKHETTIDLGFYTAPLEEFVVAIYLSLLSTIIECMSCVPSFTTLRINMSSGKKIRQALTEIANIHQTRIFFWPEILHFSRRAPCANMWELDLQCIHGGYGGQSPLLKLIIAKISWWPHPAKSHSHLAMSAVCHCDVQSHTVHYQCICHCRWELFTKTVFPLTNW